MFFSCPMLWSRPTTWCQMWLVVGYFCPSIICSLCNEWGRHNAGRNGGLSPFLGWEEELPHGTGRPCIPDSGEAIQLAGWAMLHLIYKLAWRLTCARTWPGRCHYWWEPRLWAAAVGKEFSSLLALFFTSPDCGTICVCSAALPEDPERSCPLVLRKQIVPGNRRGMARMGQKLHQVLCWVCEWWERWHAGSMLTSWLESLGCFSVRYSSPAFKWNCAFTLRAVYFS